MTQYNTWSELKSPNDWVLDDISIAGGIYQLLSVNDEGHPIVLESVAKDLPQDIKNAGEKLYAGVIYIGKAGDLHKRFWKLVRSWKTQNSTSQPHESRKTWNSDKTLQTLYPINNMRCRFMAIGHTKAKDRLSEDAKIYHDNLFGKDDDGRKTNQPTAAAVAVNESSELMKYEKLMGKRPPLNKKGADRPDVLPDCSFSNKLSEKEQANLDDFIIMQNVYDNDGKIKSEIKSQMDKDGK